MANFNAIKIEYKESEGMVTFDSTLTDGNGITIVVKNIPFIDNNVRDWSQWDDKAKEVVTKFLESLEHGEIQVTTPEPPSIPMPDDGNFYTWNDIENKWEQIGSGTKVD